MPNRLSQETSPYLLQHAHNPVDWHPWGPEALEKARQLDRPILLSVGYSACHWCHVMERESFEDERIAALMNRHFVNVKVDREERPDVDSLYMNYVQMSTGSGGWPLTVFLTPGMVPFFGGTYFPPDDRLGRPGFPRVLESVAEAYQTKKEELERMTPSIVEQLSKAVRFETPASEVKVELLEEAAANLARNFDSRFGGFGGAPKFPSAMALSFLLRHHARSGAAPSLEMVEKSLRAMADGGMYDQLGGGFHRYSVDDQWLVPHFEKMLYDNALLARCYLEAFQATGDGYYRRVAEETLEYVRRDLTDPSGGFYSAEDADSEGEEGKFYVWSRSQIESLLPGEDAELFCESYGVSEGGNFEGHNILHRPVDEADLARRHSLEESQLRERLAGARRTLFEAREQRVRPGLDDKVLASWNGWMLSAFSLGALVLDRDDWREAAERNGRFLAESMMHEGRLHRTWKQGEARLAGYLEDYAAVGEGFLGLYELTGETRWLALARELAGTLLEQFRDPQRGDFYFTAADHEKLLVRQKEHMDNATPSGNSNACSLLLRLTAFTGNEEYRQVAGRMLEQMGLACSQHPLAFGNWLQCLDFYLGPVIEIAVLGPEPKRAELIEPVRERFLPRRVLVQGDAPDPDVPLLADKPDPGEEAAGYVCRDFTCGPPAHAAEELANQLE